VGGTALVTANVTSGLGSATVSQMAFGSYTPNVATVNPNVDYVSPYSTTVTGLSSGTSAIWATAILSDNRICQSTGSTDCDITVPAPTHCPVPTIPHDPPTFLCTPVGGTSMITWQWNAVLDTDAGPGIYASNYEIGIYNSTGALVKGTNNGTFLPASGFGCASGGMCQWQTPLPAGTYYSRIWARGTCSDSAFGQSGNVATTTCSGTLHSISGKLFNDPNGNGKSIIDNDTNYTTGVFNVSSFPAAGVNSPPGTGTYQIPNLPEGEYTITFGGLDATHSFTYPSSSLTVDVGATCSYPPTSEASCSSGNIAGLNAGVGIVNGSAWIQTTGADLRLDKGSFANLLPPATYTSVPFVTGMPPGVVFTGNSTPFYGSSGQASPANWSVGSPQFPEFFTDTHGNIPTSYTFLVSAAQALNIKPTTISSINGITRPGIYTSGDMTIASPVNFGNFGTGNFVILVNGDLIIKAKITVPIGSTAVFSVKKDITVDENVGELAGTLCDASTHEGGCDIEGLYSADHSFIADGEKGNKCPTTGDKRLNVAGSVIANAGRGGGAFENNRSLCTDNSTGPSVSFTERPDFMLNYPSFVKQIPRAWQELAP